MAWLGKVLELEEDLDGAELERSTRAAASKSLVRAAAGQRARPVDVNDAPRLEFPLFHINGRHSDQQQSNRKRKKKKKKMRSQEEGLSCLPWWVAPAPPRLSATLHLLHWPSEILLPVGIARGTAAGQRGHQARPT